MATQYKDRTVDSSSLRPGERILVRGRVTWCRIASFIDGDELAEKNARRREYNISPIETKHTSISIDKAEVFPRDKNNITIEERFIDGRFFKNSNASQTQGGFEFEGWRYSIDNKSPYLPFVARKGQASKGENPREFYQIYPKYDLERGSEVLLILKVFKGRMNHNGVGLDGVIILDDEPRFFTPNGDGGVNGQLVDYLKPLGVKVHLTQKEDVETELSGEDAAKAAAQTTKPTDINVNAAAPAPADDPAGLDDLFGGLGDAPVMDEASTTFGISYDDFS